MLLIYEIKVNSHICVAILHQKITRLKYCSASFRGREAWQELCLHDDANDNIVLSMLVTQYFTKTQNFIFLNLIECKTFYHSRIWCLLSWLMTFLMHGIGYSITPDNVIITPIRMKPEL